MAHLKQGGSIAGRWGRLVPADDDILIEIKVPTEPLPAR
jgi:hypothetical protein